MDLLGSHAMHPRHLGLVLDGCGPGPAGSGTGTALVEEMERRIAGARLVIVETAGRPDYAATRGFYEARGYRAVRRIPDFYAPGDDQVTYVKYFALPADF